MSRKSWSTRTIIRTTLQVIVDFHTILTDPDDLIMAYELQARILRLIENKDRAENCAEGLTLLARLIRPVFIPITVERGAHEVDRTSSFFYGFPWTSEEFPWPDRCQDAISGWLGAPRLQLNLDQVTESIGQEVGSGLLQVFLPGSYKNFGWYGRDGDGIDAGVRRIPPDAINSIGALTPFALEGMSLLEICQELKLQFSEPPYKTDSSVDPVTGEEFLADGWTPSRIQEELEDEGLFSDRNELRALQIDDWEPFVPEGHVQLSNLSDEEICAAFEDWRPGRDRFGCYDWSNHDIIREILMADYPDGGYPVPGLFSWPVSGNGQAHAINSGQLPLIVFHGLQHEFGDSIDVFPDTSFWSHGC